jgi:D-tyrosyl-tRNA(Tyr) deacylase
MRAVVQRVKKASVSVDGRPVSQIGVGLLVLLGVAAGDTERDADYLVEKVHFLRIFPDDADKMNRDVAESRGEALVVSQFTLLGDSRKGRRPSFIDAADGETGNRLYQYYCRRLAETGLAVKQGIFAAMMDVELVNWGPVTLLLDSRKLF